MKKQIYVHLKFYLDHSRLFANHIVLNIIFFIACEIKDFKLN